MKFTDLTSAQRSMLTMLCTGQHFNTEELGKGCNPRFRPDQAASSLLGMRDQGLVYSNQKPANQAYAQWRASDYGKAVFAGRPVDVVQVADWVLPLAPAAEQKPFRVLRVCDNGITLFQQKFDDEARATAFARLNIEKAMPDVVNYVVTLHKSMRFIPPVAAGVQVEDL